MATRIRTATGADAGAVIDLISRGFETYRSFAPPGWNPPAPGTGSHLVIEAFLEDPRVWYVVAEDERGHAGQCGWNPAYGERNMRGARIPGTAHLWQLFVREDRWGSGLAAELHDMALAAMRAGGYERGRLHTPAGQARARSFYERRGWRTAPLSLEDPRGELGLEVVEYRVEL